ncbi:MAG: acyl-CoA dehydrogenase [Sphingomonadales bacterium]|nr:MAG: acyl-CoA dehydrogenase [Sphingomonadales bacterium]
MNPDTSHGQGSVYEEASAWLQENWQPGLTVRQWWRLLAESGWAYPTWPTELFGKGLPASSVSAVRDAFAERGVLGPPVRAGQKLAAPTLILHGTDAQKRDFLPALARGEEQWSQFFSEPEAGSDLAGIRTRAERDGDGWTITGRKVWSSFAQFSDRGILLARTDWSVPKHKGLTFFVIDLDQPEIEIRPLRQMNGNSEFNEVIFSGARVPAGRVVGGEGNGWKVALATLSFERFMTVAPVSALPGEKGGFLDKEAAAIASGVLASPGEGALIGRMADHVTHAARQTGRMQDTVFRQRLAELHMNEAVFQHLSRRHAAEIASGGAGSAGSIVKIMRSQLARMGRDVGLEALGSHAMVRDGTAVNELIQHFALTSPYASIAGGTDEIQKNIIAERLLGLPREAAIDANEPFSESIRRTQRPD